MPYADLPTANWQNTTDENNQPTKGDDSMTKHDPKHRRRMRCRRQGKAGSVLRILSGPELNTSACRFAVDSDFVVIKDMIATLLVTDNGVGLAAPQIGCDARMFIMWLPDAIGPIVFVNPQLTASSIEMATDKEGCLSEPGKFVSIDRHLAVWLKWYDQAGERHDKAYFGFPARIIQHEMDHLAGFCKVLSEETS